MCELKEDISYYIYVAQGKTTIPGVDDAEELRLTDVCYPRDCFVVVFRDDCYEASTGTMFVQPL